MLATLNAVLVPSAPRRTLPSYTNLLAQHKTHDEKDLQARAFHEPAHAVVGVCLGMDLRTLSIGAVDALQAGGKWTKEYRGADFAPGASVLLTGGGVFRANAVLAAAGIVAELQCPTSNMHSISVDLDSIHANAGALGINRELALGTFAAFYTSVCSEAEAILFADGGDGWKRLCHELRLHHELPNEKVLEIVWMDDAMTW